MQDKIILGVAASDSHVVANYLISFYLREHGFEVINLGVCTPLTDFMRAYDENRDALAIAIGSLNGHALEDLRELELLKQRHQVRCPIIVGGNLSVGSQKRDSLAAELEALGVSTILESPEQLLQALEELRAARSHATPRALPGGVE
jgi:methylaspartate mutase sigma subunit